MFTRVFQMWHFVNKKNCNASTIPSRAYINHIQRNFFPRTSLEGQTTWSKMVKIDQNLFFRDFSNSTIWRSHFRGKPPRSHGLFSFANKQGLSVRWHLVTQVANRFTTGQKIEGIPVAMNWNEMDTSYFGIHLGNQKSSLQSQTRAGPGSQLPMVACPRRYSPLVRNSGLGQPFHSV